MLKSISFKSFISCIVLLFLSTVFVYASADSTKVRRSDYKLSKKKFYAKYAANDSTKQQIIDHYFYKRKQGLQNVSSMPIALAFTGIMVGVGLSLPEDNPASSLVFYGSIFGAVGTLISIPITIKGIKILRVYNRKKLCILLKEIESGKKDANAVLNNFIRYELPDAE